MALTGFVGTFMPNEPMLYPTSSLPDAEMSLIEVVSPISSSNPDSRLVIVRGATAVHAPDTSSSVPLHTVHAESDVQATQLGGQASQVPRLVEANVPSGQKPVQRPPSR